MSIFDDLERWKELYVSTPRPPAKVWIVDRLMWQRLLDELPSRAATGFDQSRRLDDMPVYIDPDAPPMLLDIVDADEFYARIRAAQPAEETPQP